jgi:peptidoglycan/LPS O-acetylase OafA/YrhL
LPVGLYYTCNQFKVAQSKANRGLYFKVKKEIASLNGLRTISITFVILDHLLLRNRIHYFGHDTLVSSFINGPLGVNVFFVISGFLITKLLTAEEQRNNRVSLRNFYQRRILRIFPAYYFLLLVYFVLQLAGFLNITGASWLTALTYTKQFGGSEDWETRHLWSLSVEEVFYLFWPLVFIRFRKWRSLIAIIVVILVTYARIKLTEHPISGMSMNTIFQRADALMIGCIFAVYYDRIVLQIMKANATMKLIAALIALLLSLALPLKSPYLPVHISDELIFTFFGRVGVVTNFLIAYIMVISINLKNYWFYFLNNPLVKYIGTLSYSLYLWQQLFISFRPEMNKISVPVLLLIIFCVANISYLFVEKPFLKYKAKIALQN